MKQMKQKRKSLRKDTRGFTGLEAAIVLTAFIVVAAVFSYVVLNAGFFSTQKAKEVVHTGVEQATSSAELSGDVIGYGTAGDTLNKVVFTLSTTAGGGSVDTESAIISYTDPTNYVSSITYAASEGAGKFIASDISGGTISDGDTMIDPGEKWEFTVNLDHLNVDAVDSKVASITADTTMNFSYASGTLAVASVADGSIGNLKFHNDVAGNMSVGTTGVVGTVDEDDYIYITNIGTAGAYLNDTAGATGSLKVGYSGVTGGPILSASGTFTRGGDKVEIKAMSGTVAQNTTTHWVNITVDTIMYNYIHGAGLTKPTANKQISMEFKPTVGSTIGIERTLPAYVDTIMNLR